jgi:cob(I)alamin adenosyltransferase
VDAYGEVDELNANLGTICASGVDADLATEIEKIQKELFAIGARLADPRSRIASRVTKAAVSETDVERLEKLIDSLETELPPLRRFILPGGSSSGALLHQARTVCRRVERRVVALGAAAVDPIVIVYLNRLSDLLFVMAEWQTIARVCPKLNGRSRCGLRVVCARCPHALREFSCRVVAGAATHAPSRRSGLRVRSRR